MTGTETIYAYMRDYAMSHGGNTPTLREIVRAIDGCSSTSVASYHVLKLLEDGRVQIKDGKRIIVEAQQILDARKNIL